MKTEMNNIMTKPKRLPFRALLGAEMKICWQDKASRIFNKLFNSDEKSLGIGMIGKSIVQKFLYVPEQMSAAFLFAESRDQKADKYLNQ